MSWGSLRGYGIEWKCEKCGKLTSALENGLGPCCDPELKKSLEEQAERMQRREERRKNLIFALQSRLLTADEMADVQAWGYHILIRDNVPFFEDEKRRQFADLLFAQFRIRAAVEKAEKEREERIAKLQQELEVMNKMFEERANNS